MNIKTFIALTLIAASGSAQAFNCNSPEVQTLVRQSVVNSTPFKDDPMIQRLIGAVRVDAVNTVDRNPNTGGLLCNAVLVFNDKGRQVTSAPFNYMLSRNESNPRIPLVRTAGPGSRFVNDALSQWATEANLAKIEADHQRRRAAHLRYQAERPQREAAERARQARAEAEMSAYYARVEAEQARNRPVVSAAYLAAEAAERAASNAVSDADIERIRQQRAQRGY